MIIIQEVIKSLQQTVIAFQTKLLEYSSQFNITLLSNVKSKIEILIPQTGFTHYNKVGLDDQRLRFGEEREGQKGRIHVQ